MLEKYIKDHRKAFDQGPAPKGHEARFGQRIKAAKTAGPSITIPLRRIWQAAAAGIVLLITVQAGSFFWGQEPLDDQPSQEVMVELSDLEIYYGSKVRKEVSQLDGEVWKRLDVTLSLKHDLELLEKEYKELKKSILTEGRNEYLIDALIQNYEERISLLREISTIIQKTKKDNERETIQSS